MSTPLPNRIAALKAKKDALAARLGALESKAKTEERKRDTRRKIIVGGAVLAAIGQDDILASRVRLLLRDTVKRPHDHEAVADLLGPTT